jgi:hypothetical protein
MLAETFVCPKCASDKGWWADCQTHNEVECYDLSCEGCDYSSCDYDWDCCGCPKEGDSGHECKEVVNV